MAWSHRLEIILEKRGQLCYTNYIDMGVWGLG